MIDASIIFAFLALLMSALAIGVSLLSRRDSKRSADAAENSAREAMNARKIGQSGLLKPLFDEINRLLDMEFGIMPAGENQAHEWEKVINDLHASLNDVALFGALNKLLEFSKSRELYRFYKSDKDFQSDQSLSDIPEHIQEVKKLLNVKKNQYLSISGNP